VGDLYRGSSKYHDIAVETHDGRLELRFSGRSQGATDVETRLALGAPVLAYLHIPVALAASPTRALIVGLGGGVLPRSFLHDYPGMAVDVVEIDPEVVRLCEEFFGLPGDERLRVFVEGGREYLERSRECYDIIVIDAFFVHPTAGYATPFEFVTEEFFRAVSDRLSPHGILAFNVVGALNGRGSGPLPRPWSAPTTLNAKIPRGANRSRTTRKNSSVTNSNGVA
jgi:spermidine synthase